MLQNANSLLGLLAAALWGGGDFCGSIAVKRMNASIRGALQVVITGHLLSLAVVTLLAWWLHDPGLKAAALVWGVGGGMIAGVSLVAFYMALATGHMGSSAAVSGLLCAAVPAAVSAASEGNPGWRRLFGFLLAGIAIWLIASTGEDLGHTSRRAMRLSILGGLGFGVYFVSLKYAGSGGLLWPLASSRVGSGSICAILLALMTLRTKSEHITLPGRHAMAWIAGGTALDTCGNLSFIAATRAGRLDVAAVLASIYPAGTILLAALVLHEKTTRAQKGGMLLALAAVLLITLK